MRRESVLYLNTATKTQIFRTGCNLAVNIYSILMLGIQAYSLEANISFKHVDFPIL